MDNSVNVKALNSAKWLMLVGALSSVCSMLITTILGRISPSLLGKYSLVISFLNLTTTIVCMGGSVILSRYIIRAEDIVIRTRLFFTYIYLVLIVYFLFAVILFLCPDVYSVFVGDVDKNIKVFSIFCMIPVYAAVTVISYLLTALLEAKISKIIGCLYSVGMCVVCIILYIADSELLNEYIYIISFSTILCMNVIALIIGVIYIKKNQLLCFGLGSFKPLIYKGSFIFVLCTLGQAILVYLNGNFDKIFLSQLSGLGQLGFYQAILYIVAIVELVPKLLGDITIPFFSSIIGAEDTERVRENYKKIEKTFILFLATAVFGMIAVSDLLLAIFGEEYMKYKDALVIMLSGILLSSRGFLNTPMLVNMDKHIWRLINSILQVAIQIVMIYFLIGKIGLYAAILAKTVTVIMAQFLPQYIINKSKYHIGFSKQYIIAAICVCFLCFIIIVFKFGFIMNIASSISIYIIFFFGAGYSIRDLANELKKLWLSREKKNAKY